MAEHVAQPADDALLMTEVDYLAFEEQAAEKHEYVDGYVYALHGPIAQAGASRRHNRLQMNTLDVLRAAARRNGCEAFASDLRVRIRRAGRLRYYYPDALVTCDLSEPLDNPYTESPLLIVEVTSPRSTRYDRIVSHREQRVDCYWRVDAEHDWQHAAYTTGDIWLEPLAVSLNVEDIYA
jgi:Uma2 family endonuclease